MGSVRAATSTGTKAKGRRAKQAASGTKHVGPGNIPLRFAGKRFAVVGEFDVLSRSAARRAIVSEGGEVSDFKAGIDVLLAGAGRGGSQTSAEAKALKWNLAGKTAIEVLNERQFVRAVWPTQGEAVQLIHAGAPGLERLQALLLMPGDDEYLARAPGVLDLSGAKLSGVTLTSPPFVAVHGVPKTNLKGADLRGANLEGATLHGVADAKFDQANLETAVVSEFNNVSLKRARLGGARIGSPRGCDFANAEMQGATVFSEIVECNMRGIRASGAHLSDVKFVATVLDGANLEAAELAGVTANEVSFAGAKLAGADLSSAKLQGADLTKADLRGANLSLARLDGANLGGARLEGANLTGVDLGKVDTSGARGVAEAVRGGTLGPAVKQLDQLRKQSQRIGSSLRIDLGQAHVVLTVSAETGSSYNRCDGRAVVHRDDGQQRHYWVNLQRLSNTLFQLAARFAHGEPRFDTLSVRSTKASVSNKELRTLVRAAWCEALGVQDIGDQKRVGSKEKQRLQAELISDLEGGTAGIKRWNARTMVERTKAGHFRKVDLANRKLDKVNLRELDFQGAKLSGASLKSAELKGTDLKKADLTGADLTRASLGSAKLNEARLDGAKLGSAKLRATLLKKASLKGASLEKASLGFADLCGADLSGAKLAGAKLEGTVFDHETLWPENYDVPEGAEWRGTGRDPRVLRQIAQKPSGPIDFDTFMQNLSSHTDAGKLNKAKKMLKADSFRLFADVTDEHLVGVVKSQSDDSLVYSCRLQSDGVYTCCTQNLNVCGGLRGSPCKHLLVLIMGLAKSGQLDPRTVDDWVDASRGQRPLLDRDAMSEVLLRYKGAEAGEVDWRPTETIPEDYYAL